MATRSSAIGRAKTARRPVRHVKIGELSGRHPAVLLGITTAALVLLGLVMVLSASSVESFASSGSSFVYFQKQLIWVSLGVVAYVIGTRIHYLRLRAVARSLFALSVLLLMVVLIPGVGTSVGGSARWIALGPLTFQPSELAKLALVLFLADAFATKKEVRLRDLRETLIPVLPAIGILAFLVMRQPDLGTTLLLGITGMGVLFVAGAPVRYMATMFLTGAALGAIGALVAPYRRARILAFLDPWKDPLVTGYHTIQSLIALGSGGLFGVGLGASRQKWLYVPNAHTDFIFAIIGEELGLMGTATVVGIFGFVCYLGIRIAARAADRFGMLVAAGITIWISVQAMVNMGAVTGAMPITGVPLPLVSFGGSSLVVSMLAMGILTNIAIYGRHGSRAKTSRTAAAGS
ncbi:MAG: putative lipid II flippase FtsW [Actinomycetota bacterium]